MNTESERLKKLQMASKDIVFYTVKGWRAAPVLKPKEYKYIPNLLLHIFEKRASIPGPVNQKLTLPADVPRNISPSIAVTPHPPMQQLLQEHQSRLGN